MPADRKERQEKLRRLHETAGRNLVYALENYEQARRFRKGGYADLAANYTRTAQIYTMQAKRFAKQALALKTKQ